MPVYKDEKRGTWYSQIRYKDWTGKTRHTCKRGFKTKGAAKDYEREFLNSLSKNPEITFANLVEKYLEDMKPRLKPTTIENKRSIYDLRITPYFGDLKISKIDTLSVRNWQNEMINYRDEDGKPFSQTYLRSLNVQLSAIMNYAVKHYGLARNPCRLAGTIGKSKAKKMKFWTQEQYEQFSKHCISPSYHVYFELMFYSGCRPGEALAVYPKDVQEDLMLNIDKTFATIGGDQIIMIPKTDKSNRCISIPEFLYKELREYIVATGVDGQDERIFYYTRSAVSREFKRVTELAGLPRIRLHDLRHSHASMLIHMGVDIKVISERLGHESVKTTWDTYGHLYPDSDKAVSDKLENLKKGKNDENSEE